MGAGETLHQTDEHQEVAARIADLVAALEPGATPGDQRRVAEARTRIEAGEAATRVDAPPGRR